MTSEERQEGFEMWTGEEWRQSAVQNIK